MSATGFDTLQASRTLEEAGFERAQGDVLVATLAGAVRDGTATITQSMATKEQVAATAADLRAESAEVRAEMAEVRAEMAVLRAEMHVEFAKVRAEMAGEFKVLYRHLWLMSAGIVGLTVTLVKLIP